MESYLIYIGKAALAAGTFYLLYLALFQHQKQFVFNRIYLPVSLALSFLIPLITFTTVQYIQPVRTVASNSFAYLPEASTIVQPEFVYQWYHYLTGIYLLGIIGFLFHLLLGHFRAISIIRFSHLKELFGIQVNVSKTDVHPFSFFNKIVLSEKTLDNPNLKVIVNHEMIHVKERHTLDILFAEILFLFQWFNPFAWLIKDAMRNNLEYKTDHQIAQTNNAEAYQLAMVGLAHKKGVAPFLTALNGSQLKNRIIMMKKETENKYALLKQLVVLPLLAVLVMGLSNKEIRTEIVQPEKTVEIVVDGKVVPHNHPDLISIDFTEGIDSEKIIYALNINHVVATSLNLNGDNPTLSIRTSEYTLGTNEEFEENTTKNIVLDGTQLTEDYYYAIDNKIVSKNEFEKQGKVGFENVVFLTGTDATKKYGEEYNGLIADATSGVSNFKTSNTSIKEILIVGKLTDKDGVPLQNVKVYYTDHKKIISETYSDKEGNYKIEINEKDHLLFFRLEGYKSPSFVLEKSQTLNIKLEKTNTEEEKFMEGMSPKSPENIKSSDPQKIKGKVTDEKGIPVAGAMVLIKETKIGTVTDAKGDYLIESDSPIESLVVMIKGYVMTEVKVDGGSLLNIVLKTPKKQQPANPNNIEIVQVYKIHGEVSDEQGNPIPAAMIVVKGKNHGTITDEEGKYSIASSGSAGILVFSKPGFQDKKAMMVSGELNIQLKEGTVRDTSTQNSTTEAVFSNKQTYVKETGSYPGYSNNGSKVVAYGNSNTNSNKITIKGLNNLNKNSGNLVFATDGENAPLYIIDGIEAKSIENLNLKADDIETISVLKDGSAISLYGEKGKNGVVLIETKKVKKYDATDKIIIVDGKEFEGDLNDIPVGDISSIDIRKNQADKNIYDHKGPEPDKIFIQTKTKYNSSEPLIIVDGVPHAGDINDINPENIKSVDVLKDASSVAQYGELGKDGVILITTKSVDITSEIELRKFIAKTIKYPKEARESGKDGIAQLFVKVNNDGIIYSVSEKIEDDAIFVDEVVVAAYKPENPVATGYASKDEANEIKLFERETKKVINQLPIIDIPEYLGKTLGITVKFELQ